MSFYDAPPLMRKQVSKTVCRAVYPATSLCQACLIFVKRVSGARASLVGWEECNEFHRWISLGATHLLYFCRSVLPLRSDEEAREVLLKGEFGRFLPRHG